MVAKQHCRGSTRRQGVTISAAGRICYLNLFYSGLLGGHNTTIDYDFYDTDLTAHWAIDDKTPSVPPYTTTPTA